MEYKIDFTKAYYGIKDNIVAGSDIEDFILEHYSTNKEEMAKVYLDSLTFAIKFLVGEERKHPLSVFDILDESTYNDSYMRLLDLIEYYIVSTVKAGYDVVRVVEVKKEDQQVILTVRSGDAHPTIG
nr:MAG TPA: hypothetical protein [Caudoviricetes sp.]